MGWTEQEYNSQRQSFINEIARVLKREQGEIKKARQRQR